MSVFVRHLLLRNFCDFPCAFLDTEALLERGRLLTQNGMLINTAKTKVMLLTTPQKRIHLNKDMLLLTLNNEKLTVVSSENFRNTR